jgi:hypothetical protein
MSSERVELGAEEPEPADPGEGDEDNIVRRQKAEPRSFQEDEPRVTEDRDIPKDEGDVGGISDDPLPDPVAVYGPDDIGVET